MKSYRRALVAGVIVALSWQPTVAYGDSVTRRDAVGDLVRSAVGSTDYQPAPGRVEGDITFTRVTHGPRLVKVVVGMRELTTTSNGDFHRLRIVSNRRYRAIDIDAYPDRWAGTAVTRSARGKVVACAVRHQIDYVRNRLIVHVPRACFGKPRRVSWVRVAVRSTVAGTVRVFADDARSTGIDGRMRYGPRVHR